MSTRIPGQIGGTRRLAGIAINGDPTAILNSLQFNSTTNSFDWVAGGALSELEFLQGKEASGDLRAVNGQRINLTGVVIAITPPNGTTTVIVFADLLILVDAAGSWNVALRIDGTVVDSSNNIGGGAVPPAGTFPIPLNVAKAKQLVGDGVKTIDINVLGQTNTTVITGNIEAYDL